MNTVPYPQSVGWSWPTTPISLNDPEPWQPRKWMEQITRQLRETDLPTVAQRWFGSQAVASAAELQRTLVTVGENRRPIEDVRDCVLIRQRGRQFLSALRGMDNHLQLLSWRVNAEGTVVRTGESGVQPETVTQIDIAHASKFVIACRTASRHLKLISWDVSNTGAIYRAGESREQPTTIHSVKLVALQPTLLLTAVITTAGHLQLTSWQLDAQADLTPLYQVADNTTLRELTVVSLPGLETNQRVLTVARTRRGDLQLQVWQVNDSGEITPLAAETLPGPCGTQIRAVVNEAGIATIALRTPSGQRRLYTWQISAAGTQITRLADSGEEGEKIRHHTLMAAPGGVISAVTLPQGRIQLTAWAISSAGQLARSQQGEKTALAARNLVLCPAWLDGNAPIVTSLCTTEGALRLITWQGNAPQDQ